MEHLLESMHEILPIRRISSDKLAFCSMLTYAHDRNTLCNTIIRGFTCATEANILSIPIRNIYHHYGNDLIDLYRRVPMNAFYLVKSFMNLNFPIFDDYNPVDYIWDQNFILLILWM
uniref:YAP binding domain-containing protein n=1 Tax=Acrobeloides nanus TaxID=290746 RepID=A0A914EQU2_9BILA